MQRLYISAWISTVIAIIGYVLVVTAQPGAEFLFPFGVIAASLFCLINAFWLISKKQFSSGAFMYCVLLLNLFMMFKIKSYNYVGTLAMLFAGLFFFLLAVVARFLEKRKSFDTPSIYAVATILVSSLVLSFYNA